MQRKTFTEIRREKLRWSPYSFVVFFLKTNIWHKSKKYSLFSWSWKVLKRTCLKGSVFWLFSKNFPTLLWNPNFLPRPFPPCFFLLLSLCHSMACSDSSQFTMTERLIFRKYISHTATFHPLLKTKTFTQPEASYRCQHTLTLFWHVAFLLIQKMMLNYQ